MSNYFKTINKAAIPNFVNIVERFEKRTKTVVRSNNFLQNNKSLTMNNYFIFSGYCVGISLLFMQMMFPKLPQNVAAAGIFDIQNKVETQSNVEFNTEKSEGVCTYQTKRISSSELSVAYTFERKAFPNPFIVNYDFEIRKISNEDYEMDMKAAMPFQSLNIGSNVETVYQGTHLTYPNMPKIGETLPSAKGELRLQFKADKTHFLSYEVEVKDRKFLKKEQLSINGKKHEVYIHTYHFIQKTILKNGQIISILNDNVTEWLVPNHGLVKQERDGTVVIPTMKADEKENQFEVKSLSTVLSIKY